MDCHKLESNVCYCVSTGTQAWHTIAWPLTEAKYQLYVSLYQTKTSLLSILTRSHHKFTWSFLTGKYSMAYAFFMDDMYLMVCYVLSCAASPPKFISFDQLMDAANGVKNMTLAHEIAVNNNFQIEQFQPEENRCVHFFSLYCY